MADESSNTPEGIPIEVFFESLHELVGMDANAFLSMVFSDPSDWAFIIKLCAVIETTTSHLLTITLGSDKIREQVTMLPLGDTKYGKMEFLKSLDLLSDDVRKFIKFVSELRNVLAHDIRKVNFSLNNYLGDLRTSNPNKFKSLRELLLFKPDAPLVAIGDEKTLGEQAKGVMYARCLKFLAQVYLEHHKRFPNGA